jgi:hypothetical protein
MLLGNSGSVDGTVMFNLHLCALLCQLHVSWPSEMQFGVVQLEKLARTQSFVTFSILEFHSPVFAINGAHMAPILIYCVGQCLFCLAPCILTWIFLIGWHSVKRWRNSCRTRTVANSRDGSDVNDNRFQYMKERHETQHTDELGLRLIHALWDFTTR